MTVFPNLYLAAQRRPSLEEFEQCFQEALLLAPKAEPPPPVRCPKCGEDHAFIPFDAPWPEEARAKYIAEQRTFTIP
jgi:hypothetical protein